MRYSLVAGRALIALGVMVAVAASSSTLDAQAKAAKADKPELAEAKALLERYKDPLAAVHDGFFSTVACIEVKEGGEGQLPYKAGGMGVHFFNAANISPTPDPAKPQVLIYEPRDGKLKLVAAEWFVPLEIAQGVPELWGQKFDGPMPGHHPIMPEGLAHYDLHVWLFKDNPNGMFHATNPNVSCEGDPYRFVEDAPKAMQHAGH